MKDVTMKGLTMWSCLALLLLSTAPNAASAAATASRDQRPREANLAQRLSRAHFEFSLNLYGELVEGLDSSEGEGANLVYSPYSVQSVLSMLFLGTSSSSGSSRQLRSALKYDNISYVDVHSGFRKVVENFGDKYYERKVRGANALFVQNGVAVSAPYERALREFYQSRVTHMDFRDAGRAVESVNDWVDDVTGGQIPALLDAPPSADAKLLLVNAMSMSAKWLNPFSPVDTFEKGLFFLGGNRRMEIPMMSGRFTLPLGYSPEMECRILELPFTQKRISMFILLPDETDGLASLEQKITAENVKMLFTTLEDDVVNVRIPRFRIKTEARITEALQSLGVTDIFDPSKSDLHLLAPNSNLHLSSVAHKSVMEVSEQGVRGSAATHASVERVGAFGQEFFEADHPFIFLVWDYYSGMLLLMGRVVHPLDLGSAAGD